MSAHYTRPGLPTLPAADFAAPTLYEYTASQMREYRRQCYDAGRADHIAEVGQMVPLTQEQVLEIARRFEHLLGRMDRAVLVIRATENAHGIASPKEQTL